MRPAMPPGEMTGEATDSAIQCALHCMQSATCVSFATQPVAPPGMRCHLYPLLCNTTDLVPDVGWDYYTEVKMPCA